MLHYFRQPPFERSLLLLKLENALTSTIFDMPIITLFWQISLGMSWGQIVALQLIFMAVMIMANVPTGYLADRYSPRLANLVGDVIATGGWLLYALAPNFAVAVIAEVVLGLGMATSSDADRSLVKWYTVRLVPAYRRPNESDEQTAHRLYDHHQGQMELIRVATNIPSMLIGGWLGLAGARLGMAATGTLTVLGAITTYFLYETGPLLPNRNSTGERTSVWKLTLEAWRDMWRITREAFRPPYRLAWALAAQAIGAEFTHASVWLLSPMLVAVHVPTAVIGAAWAGNFALTSLGKRLPSIKPLRKWYLRTQPATLFAIGAVMALTAMATFSLSVNAGTIWLFGLMGLTRGWFGRVSSPIIQRETPADRRSTIGSLGSTLYRLLYMAPMLLLWLTSGQGFEAMYRWQLALFLPLTLAVYLGLRRSFRR
ncbi:MAG TPA: MFS transporter [Candidatus Saccharimonadia bacterium]